MSGKRYVLGDLHGNYKALMQVLEKSKFDYELDTLITLGDENDGHSQTYEVIEELLKIKNLVRIDGNHNHWLRQYIIDGSKPRIWTSQGGIATLSSYEAHGGIPDTHKEFFNNALPYLELDNMLFIHGGFNYNTHPKYNKHPRNCDTEELTWDREFLYRSINGLKVTEWDKVFLGHTQSNHMDFLPGIFNLEKDQATVYQVDCGAGWKGKLCLMNIDTDEYFLSDLAGDLY